MGDFIRRWCRRILQIHKIVSNKTSNYLSSKLPRNRWDLYRHSNNNSFHEILCKSNRYLNSFFPDGTKSWNIVISHFDKVPSFGILKNYITSLIRPQKKSLFNIHDPIGTRYLF